MEMALVEAQRALDVKELPIGGVLVGGDQLISVSQTSVRRHGSIVAHGELLALLDAKDRIYSCDRPLVLYTTLEPCLMCLGAMMQCEVDKVVFGMRCAPDGATELAKPIAASGQRVPDIAGGVLEDRCVEVFRKWNLGTQHPAYSYVQAILNAYEQ
jgi:tRNA(adenine34) deaminase